MWFLKLLLRPTLRRAARQILAGRLVERGCPEKGRFLHHDVDRLLDRTWLLTEEMLPEARLERIPTLGNLQNVLLAVLTVAAYRAFQEEGIEREYAIELFADIGWKFYAKFIFLPRIIARLITRDPQRQINLIVRMMMIFPFSTPGRPGYECKAWAEPDAYCTNWTHCAPLSFVKEYAERHGDHGEVEAFRKSWCWYDWAVTYSMVDGGYGKGGHYERPHSLSEGDEVCDMRWRAEPPSAP